MKIHDITGSLLDSPRVDKELKNEIKSAAVSEVNQTLVKGENAQTPDIQSIMAQAGGHTPPLSKAGEKQVSSIVPKTSPTISFKNFQNDDHSVRKRSKAVQAQQSTVSPSSTTPNTPMETFPMQSKLKESAKKQPESRP